MARTVKGNCLICGRRVDDGRAVFMVGSEVERPAEYYSSRNRHEEDGTAVVRFRNRNPKGIVHEECIAEVLYPNKKKPTSSNPLMIKDAHREWDE